MLASLKNIQSAFSYVRIFLVLMTLLSLGVSIYAIYASYQFAEAQRQRIYVLDQNQSLLMALSQDVQQNRKAEALSHVQRFHEYFFTLSPDKEAIEEHIEQALYLADAKAAEMYLRMKESGFYERIIASGIVCEIKVDSIHIDDSVYPHQVTTYAMTSLVRSSNITYRNLITTCTLINCSRSVHNPHGFLIENWKVVENKDIQTIHR